MPRRGHRANQPEIQVVKLSSLAARNGTKYTKAEREEMRVRIAEMRLRGLTFREIGEACNIAPQTAYSEFKVVENRWRATAQNSLMEMQARELARLDMVEREAWEAYQRSQEDATDVGQRYVGSGDERVLTNTSAKKRARDGDARFLQIVLNCIDRRVKLLGLDREELQGSPGGINDPARHNHEITERLARYTGILGIAIVGVEGRPAAEPRLAESVDTPRSPYQAGGILDVDELRRDTTP